MSGAGKAQARTSLEMMAALSCRLMMRRGHREVGSTEADWARVSCRPAPRGSNRKKSWFQNAICRLARERGVKKAVAVEICDGGDGAPRGAAQANVRRHVDKRCGGGGGGHRRWGHGRPEQASAPDDADAAEDGEDFVGDDGNAGSGAHGDPAGQGTAKAMAAVDSSASSSSVRARSTKTRARAPCDVPQRGMPRCGMRALGFKRRQ
jgi:hypothetical protein